MLTGPTLILVDRIESIDVWEKLITSYGNTKLLLENKITSLENVGAFRKISGDERIRLALATLINTMGDLSTLAQKFKLENELYYGGCLEKIFSLLGNKEREFVCKGHRSNTTKPSEGKRLDFLNDELIQREKMNLFVKSKKAKSFQHDLSGKPVICHFCSETGHVTTKNEGQEVIQYYACKNIVDMSPEQRRKALYERKLCAGCLQPGVRLDDKHNCSNMYVCTNDSYKQFTRGWYVLVCMRHREQNQGLLNK